MSESAPDSLQAGTSAWIGLGSNLGDREATLEAAVRDLGSLGEVLRVSSYYETAPVGFLDQPCFVNAALELRTELAPLVLLQALLVIEREHGREREAGETRFGPRTLDLDILFYGDRTVEEACLEIPHPRLHERRFVLEPLCEIAPDLVHPKLGVTVSTLLERLSCLEEARP